ncbi:putative dehydrogenase [Kribbella amoyensis]|uniref:Putative dehydrogenase n=1 Tax=Kribbella amoyensis TaxID=996641 RepID=A0A561BLH9_9ACTN|nr:Gfo/Idh/MocA family oxidoreductase [Kribbella amoyensis]TWD79744.1 putative dehydrogenase [Kribbella amoyensis]
MSGTGSRAAASGVQPEAAASSASTSTPTGVPRVALIGVHGYGANHLRRVTEYAADGRVQLVAIADPNPPAADDLPPGTPTYDDLSALLAAQVIDVAVISTPIHTHVPLAELALRAGADVLLEKPPAASLAEFEQLSAVVTETGRICQVGFQSHGSAAAHTLASWVADGRLGEVRGIGAVGAWIRTDRYWQRSRWAGKRMLDGIAVVDGAVTNAFAHASATALLVDGSGRSDQIVSVETELYRANPVESDDTSTVRIRTSRGTTLLTAVSLCAEVPDFEPAVIVHGSQGRAVLRYRLDQIELTVDGDTTITQYDREDLLGNLLDHRADPSVPLLAPLAETGGFTGILEAIRTSPPPAAIDPALVRWEGEGLDRHPMVQDVSKWVSQATEDLALFGEIGAPWATNERNSPS